MGLSVDTLASIGYGIIVIAAAACMLVHDVTVMLRYRICKQQHNVNYRPTAQQMQIPGHSTVCSGQLSLLPLLR